MILAILAIAFDLSFLISLLISLLVDLHFPKNILAIAFDLSFDLSLYLSADPSQVGAHDPHYTSTVPL